MTDNITLPRMTKDAFLQEISDKGALNWALQNDLILPESREDRFRKHMMHKRVSPCAWPAIREALEFERGEGE